MNEETLRSAVSVLISIVEIAGAIVIFVGAIVGFAMFLRNLYRRQIAEFTSTRLLVARFLALGLEFQLAPDILSTAVAPSFEEIGKLAAIAAIRTLLNYFLSQEMKGEERQEGERRKAQSS